MALSSGMHVTPGAISSCLAIQTLAASSQGKKESVPGRSTPKKANRLLDSWRQRPSRQKATNGGGKAAKRHPPGDAASVKSSRDPTSTLSGHMRAAARTDHRALNLRLVRAASLEEVLDVVTNEVSRLPAEHTLSRLVQPDAATEHSEEPEHSTGSLGNSVSSADVALLWEETCARLFPPVNAATALHRIADHLSRGSKAAPSAAPSPLSPPSAHQRMTVALSRPVQCLLAAARWALRCTASSAATSALSSPLETSQNSPSTSSPLETPQSASSPPSPDSFPNSYMPPSKTPEATHPHTQRCRPPAAAAAPAASSACSPQAVAIIAWALAKLAAGWAGQRAPAEALSRSFYSEAMTASGASNTPGGQKGEAAEEGAAAAFGVAGDSGFPAGGSADSVPSGNSSRDSPAPVVALPQWWFAGEFDLLAAAALPLLPAFLPRDLCMLAHAMASCRHQPPPALLQAMGQRASELLTQQPTGNQSQLGAAGNATGDLPAPQQPIVNGAAACSAPAGDKPTAADAGPPGRASPGAHSDEAVTLDQRQHTTKRAVRASFLPRDVAQLMWALAVLGGRPPPGLLLALEAHLQAPASPLFAARWTLRDAAMALWALAAAGVESHGAFCCLWRHACRFVALEAGGTTRGCAGEGQGGRAETKGEDERGGRSSSWGDGMEGSGSVALSQLHQAAIAALLYETEHSQATARHSGGPPPYSNQPNSTECRAVASTLAGQQVLLGGLWSWEKGVAAISTEKKPPPSHDHRTVQRILLGLGLVERSGRAAEAPAGSGCRGEAGRECGGNGNKEVPPAGAKQSAAERAGPDTTLKPGSGWWVSEYCGPDTFFYSLDIALPEWRVAIEIDGPSHFARNTYAPMGATLLKRRHLQAAGWKVLPVPFFIWEALDGDAAREEFISSLLEQAESSSVL